MENENSHYVIMQKTLNSNVVVAMRTTFPWKSDLSYFIFYFYQLFMYITPTL